MFKKFFVLKMHKKKNYFIVFILNNNNTIFFIFYRKFIFKQKGVDVGVKHSFEKILLKSTDAICINMPSGILYNFFFFLSLS